MCLAVPGKIISITGEDPLERVAKVSFGGVIKDINLAYLPEAKIDDYVVVHVGFALSILDQAEADEIFEYLNQLADAEQENEVTDEVRRRVPRRGCGAAAGAVAGEYRDAPLDDHGDLRRADALDHQVRHR